jgi:ribosomal protein L19E
VSVERRAESRDLESGERRGNKNSKFDMPKKDIFKKRIEYTQNILKSAKNSKKLDLFPWRMNALNLEWSH